MAGPTPKKPTASLTHAEAIVTQSPNGTPSVKAFIGEPPKDTTQLKINKWHHAQHKDEADTRGAKLGLDVPQILINRPALQKDMSNFVKQKQEEQLDHAHDQVRQGENVNLAHVKKAVIKAKAALHNAVPSAETLNTTKNETIATPSVKKTREKVDTFKNKKTIVLEEPIVPSTKYMPPTPIIATKKPIANHMKSNKPRLSRQSMPTPHVTMQPKPLAFVQPSREEQNSGFQGLLSQEELTAQQAFIETNPALAPGIMTVPSNTATSLKMVIAPTGQDSSLITYGPRALLNVGSASFGIENDNNLAPVPRTYEDVKLIGNEEKRELSNAQIATATTLSTIAEAENKIIANSIISENILTADSMIATNAALTLTLSSNTQLSALNIVRQKIDTMQKAAPQTPSAPQPEADAPHVDLTTGFKL